MLTHVEVMSDQGALLTLSLEDTAEGYVVESIEGLDPVNATLVYSSFAQLDKSEYQSSKREKRNLVFNLEFEPTWGTNTVESLRKRLYSWFMPKSRVRLRFFEDTGLVVDIVGRVESTLSPRFAKDPDVKISIVCGESDFLGLTPVKLTGFTTAGTASTLVDYEGSVEAGLLFKLYANRTMSSFSIFHQPADDTVRQLDFAFPLIAGDVVEISTVPGSKSGHLIRAGVRSSVLFAIAPQSNWINFFIGANKIRVFSSGAQVPYSIDYLPRYGGL